jgi:Zn-dependent protease
VSVQPSFWLTNVLLGYGLVQGQDGHVMRLLIWMAVAFLSILWHELGHALMFRRYGMESEIVLYAFGGYAMPLGGRALTRAQDVVVSAAGPVFQLLVGVPLWWLHREGKLNTLYGDGTFAGDVVGFLMWVNLAWALVNLLPVFPLDGGRICHAILGPRQQKTALTISLVCAAGASVACFSFRLVFSGIFFALLAWNNWRRLNNEPELPW